MSNITYIDDTLDSKSFDPILYINNKFPNENSLNDIDTFIIGINCKINNLNDEISKAVQAQSRAGEQATRVKLNYIKLYYIILLFIYFFFISFLFTSCLFISFFVVVLLL